MNQNKRKRSIDDPSSQINEIPTSKKLKDPNMLVISKPMPKLCAWGCGSYG